MPIPPIPPPALVIEQAFQQQIQSLQERLRQSEVNLAAQRDLTQINKKVISRNFFLRNDFVLFLDENQRKYSCCSSSTYSCTSSRIEHRSR